MEAKGSQWAELWLSLQENAALVGFDEESDQELQYSGVSTTKSRWKTQLSLGETET